MQITRNSVFVLGFILWTWRKKRSWSSVERGGVLNNLASEQAIGPMLGRRKKKSQSYVELVALQLHLAWSSCELQFGLYWRSPWQEVYTFYVQSDRLRDNCSADVTVLLKRKRRRLIHGQTNWKERKLCSSSRPGNSPHFTHSNKTRSLYNAPDSRRH
jgi:hypothetical protein